MLRFLYTSVVSKGVWGERVVESVEGEGREGGTGELRTSVITTLVKSFCLVGL